MNKTEKIKSELTAFLKNEDYAGVGELAQKERSVVRTLTAMSYDLDDVISWRAIDAIGRLTLVMSGSKARILVQRVLWMMREESGTNAWTSAEILGEIVARSPEAFKDIAPIVVAFHEELFMRAGALRAMYRIAQNSSELVEKFADEVRPYLRSDNAEIRGYAALALRELGLSIEELRGDDNSFRFYDGHELGRLNMADLLK